MLTKENVKAYNHQYYLQHKERLQAKKKQRYLEDTKYRKAGAIRSKAYYYLYRLQNPRVDSNNLPVYTLRQVSAILNRCYTYMVKIARNYFPSIPQNGKTVYYTRNQIKLIQFLYTTYKLPYPVFSQVLLKFWDKKYTFKEVDRYVQAIKQ